MRNFLFRTTIALFFFCAACTTAEKPGGLSATAQKNLDAFYTVDSAFQSGDLSRIDDAVASDFVDHTPYGDWNRDSLKTMITKMKTAGNMKSEIRKVLADDEYVMGWLRWSGTSDGSIPGMPAGPFNMSGVEVVRFKDGKAVEHWAFMDAVEAMKMMSPSQQTTPSTNPTSTDKSN